MASLRPRRTVCTFAFHTKSSPNGQLGRQSSRAYHHLSHHSRTCHSPLPAIRSAIRSTYAVRVVLRRSLSVAEPGDALIQPRVCTNATTGIRNHRGRDEQMAWPDQTRTSSMSDVGLGPEPSSFASMAQSRRASSACAMASSSVAPIATIPGKSGNVTPYSPFAPSITADYLFVNSIPQLLAVCFSGDRGGDARRNVSVTGQRDDTADLGVPANIVVCPIAEGDFQF